MAFCAGVSSAEGFIWFSGEVDPDVTAEFSTFELLFLTSPGLGGPFFFGLEDFFFFEPLASCKDSSSGRNVYVKKLLPSGDLDTDKYLFRTALTIVSAVVLLACPVLTISPSPSSKRKSPSKRPVFSADIRALDIAAEILGRSPARIGILSAFTTALVISFWRVPLFTRLSTISVSLDFPGGVFDLAGSELVFAGS